MPIHRIRGPIPKMALPGGNETAPLRLDQIKDQTGFFKGDADWLSAARNVVKLFYHASITAPTLVMSAAGVATACNEPAILGDTRQQRKLVRSIAKKLPAESKTSLERCREKQKEFTSELRMLKEETRRYREEGIMRVNVSPTVRTAVLALIKAEERWKKTAGNNPLLVREGDAALKAAMEAAQQAADAAPRNAALQLAARTAKTNYNATVPCHAEREAALTAIEPELEAAKDLQKRFDGLQKRLEELSGLTADAFLAAPADALKDNIAFEAHRDAVQDILLELSDVQEELVKAKETLDPLKLIDTRKKLVDERREKSYRRKFWKAMDPMENPRKAIGLGVASVLGTGYGGLVYAGKATTEAAYILGGGIGILAVGVVAMAALAGIEYLFSEDDEF